MDDRKKPEEYLKIILEEENRKKKGKLRIFFGMAAGVGKTFQMLESAHSAKKDGCDIVVGYIETHKRKDTEKICVGLPEIKRKEILYKDTLVFETDIDEIIRRRPEIVIIDELAHTNAPGSRHKKRYQDILEILNCGVDVWTTLNVQHIESRASIVENITGIKIHETVPDYILEMADKIEIIDITPEELQKRLREGKIYSVEKTDTALNNFFREGNITALREIALQVVAKLVDKNITEYKTEHNIERSWKAADKLLVAVGPSPFSAYLIKWTKKTAFSMKAEWIAVNVESSKEMPKEQKKLLDDNINLARRLGAKIISTADEDVVNGLIRVAKQNNITQFIVGKPLLFSFNNLFKNGITERLIKESGDIDVYVVTQPGVKIEKSKKRKGKINLNFNIRESLKIALSLGTLTVFSFFMQDYIGYWGISLIYLLYIVISSSIFSRKGAIFISILSALLWNYIFIPPKYTFIIHKSEDFLMYVAFFVVALVTGSLTSKLHIKEAFLRKKENNLEILYELSKELANNTDFIDTIKKTTEYIGKYFETEVYFCLNNKETNEFDIYPEIKYLDEKNKDIALWVLSNGIAAGKGTDTLSSSDYCFYPIISPDCTEGVIILNAKSENILKNEEFIKTVSFMIGSFVIKERMIKINQKLLIEKETEKLYSIILKSISHELKTPLTSISLSVNGLYDDKLFYDKDTRNILIKDIKEGTERLNRIITNLLDMSRIESGKLKLNLQWNDLNDLTTIVTAKYKLALEDYIFNKEIDSNIPPVKFDFGLIEQVFSNILYNAIIHTSYGTRICLKLYRDKNNICVEISDNGGGIKKIDKVFDKFYKEDVKKTGGLGIGLSICKAIVDFHNWSIAAYNNNEGGATFKIFIPYKEGGK